MSERPGQPHVRPAIPDDAASIWMVQAETWMATYPNETLAITREGLREHLEGPRGEKIAERIADIRDRIESEMSGSAAGRDFVGVFNGAIVGFTAPYVEPGGRRRVGALYVLPAAQGLGIGHLLIEVNLHWHSGDRDVYLNVAAYNENAQKFYARHGFILTSDTGHSGGTIIGDVVIPELEMLRRGTQSPERPQAEAPR